ncbi:MAG: SDR family oxidoreductase [Phycisphaerales bacterium]
MREPEAKVAVVTGGGSGIGFACAELLAHAGWRVVIGGRSLRKLEQASVDLHAEIGASGTPVLPLTLDQADPESSRRFVDVVVSRLGRIDALINNAGVAVLKPIEQTDLRVIEEVFTVNATGPAFLTHLAWPVFTRQRSGCVVNVGSYASFDPFPGFFAYAASKAAVSLMAASVAKEGAALGVRGFCVAPGAVETEMLRSAFDESVVPASACLRPRDVARVVLECIEGRRDGSNGRTIYIKRAGESAALGEARVDELVR